MITLIVQTSGFAWSLVCIIRHMDCQTPLDKFLFIFSSLQKRVETSNSDAEIVPVRYVAKLTQIFFLPPLLLRDAQVVMTTGMYC